MWGTITDDETARQRADMATLFYIAMGGCFGVDVPFAPHVGFRVSADLLGTWTPVTIAIADRTTWTASGVVNGFGAGLYVFN